MFVHVHTLHAVRFVHDIFAWSVVRKSYQPTQFTADN